MRRQECRNIHVALKGLNSVWVEFEDKIHARLGDGDGNDIIVGGGGDVNGDMDLDEPVSAISYFFLNTLNSINSLAHHNAHSFIHLFVVLLHCIISSHHIVIL